jgi:glycerol-3-phosphate dehydrogenase (NAD(P)+)
MRTNVAILGAGAMGTACALLLAKQPTCNVALWSAREETGRLLQQTRENVRLLPGVRIPESILLTTSIEEAVADAHLLVIAIPTVHLRPTLLRVADLLRAGPQPAVSVIKGLENETFLRPTEIIAQVIGSRPLAVMSGPGHAEEIARNLPTSLVVASRDEALARWVQKLFSGDFFRLYTNADVVGVELAAALKNVIALAAGISDGLGFGDNAKAALLTRALVEMVRFSQAHEADPQTFFGLAGIGDLITTCISPHGRNRRVGERIGRGERLADILASMQQVAEGVYTTRSVHDRARILSLDMPITTEVYRMLYEDKPPLQAVQDLMLRDLKSEGV